MDQNISGSQTTYQIRVKGIVNRSIASLIDDLSILPLENNETLLVGMFIDQPALRGLLDYLWNLNLTILSVESVPPGETGDSYQSGQDDHEENGTQPPTG